MQSEGEEGAGSGAKENQKKLMQYVNATTSTGVVVTCPNLSHASLVHTHILLHTTHVPSALSLPPSYHLHDVGLSLPGSYSSKASIVMALVIIAPEPAGLCAACGYVYGRVPTAAGRPDCALLPYISPLQPSSSSASQLGRLSFRLSPCVSFLFLLLTFFLIFFHQTTKRSLWATAAILREGRREMEWHTSQRMHADERSVVGDDDDGSQ